MEDEKMRIKEILTRLGESYCAYLAREDAKYREAAKQRAIQQAAQQTMAFAYENLPLALELFYKVLQFVTPIIEARLPPTPEWLACNPPIRILANGLPYYCFRFYHQPLVGGRRDENLKRIKRILNKELFMLCRNRNILPLQCEVSLVEDYKVFVYLIWDWGCV
jgi:hypothetical protein